MGGGGGQRCFTVPLSLQKNKVRQDEHVYKCTGSAAAAAVAELQQEKERVTMGARTQWSGPCPCQAWLISNQHTWAAAFTSAI